MAQWSIQVTDKNYVPEGELLHIKDFQLDIPLSKTQTCQFKVRLDNPLAPLLIPEDHNNGESFTVPYIKAYRNNNLEFFGPVVTTEEIGEGEKSVLHVNAAGPSWVLAKLYWTMAPEGVKIASQNRAKTFGERLNAFALKDVKMKATWGTAAAAAYESPPVKYLSEALKELSEGVEGFDWIVLPKDAADTSTPIGTFWMEEHWGHPAPNAVFEYGGGRNNVASYKRVIDRTTQVNRAYHFLPGGPNVGPEAKEESAISQENWGVLEEAISVDVLDTTLRQTLVKEHVNIRKDPRQTFMFEPANDDGSGRVPQPGEYALGDTIPIRIFQDEGIHYSGEVRVWGVKYTLDENRNEKIALTLSNQ